LAKHGNQGSYRNIGYNKKHTASLEIPMPKKQSGTVAKQMLLPQLTKCANLSKLE